MSLRFRALFLPIVSKSWNLQNVFQGIHNNNISTVHKTCYSSLIARGYAQNTIFTKCTTRFIPVNNVRFSSTNKNGQGIHESVSALQSKKWPQRKKKTILEEDGNKPGFWNVTAFSTAEEYNLESLKSALIKQNLYEICPVGSDAEDGSQIEDVLHVIARYAVSSEPRQIFFFREGTSVFWNVSELESTNVLLFIKQFEENSYDERLVQQECEVMDYTYIESGCSHLKGESVCIAGGESNILDKYTFSNAMALSVKLGIWEASLARYVDSIEFVTEDMKLGRKIRISREEVLRKTGELFALRHLINLSSDLLDTPDFYWDHERLEALYQQIYSYFSIARRTRVVNEKLNHCVELVELLSSHLNDQHHIRLEWMIIILIMVEVLFEFLHYADRFF